MNKIFWLAAALVLPIYLFGASDVLFPDKETINELEKLQRVMGKIYEKEAHILGPRPQWPEPWPEPPEFGRSTDPAYIAFIKKHGKMQYDLMTRVREWKMRTLSNIDITNLKALLKRYNLGVTLEKFHAVQPGQDWSIVFLNKDGGPSGFRMSLDGFLRSIRPTAVSNQRENLEKKRRIITEIDKKIEEGALKKRYDLRIKR